MTAPSFNRWLDWLTANVDVPGDLDRIRARFIGGLAGLMACLMVMAVAIDLALFAPIPLFAHGLLLAVVLIVLTTLRAGWFDVSRHVFVAGVFFFANLMVYVGGGIDSITIVPLFFLLILSLCLLPARSGVLVASCVLAAGLAQLNLLTPRRAIEIPPAGMFSIATFMITVMMLGLVRLTTAAMDDVRDQQEILRTTVIDLKSTSISRDRITGILSALDAFVVVTDADRKIVQINTAVERIGWSIAELEGTSLQDLFTDLDPESPSTWRNASVVTPSLETIPVAVTQGDFGDDRHVWAATDVGAERAAMSALSQANQRAHAASTAKSNFLANMSHELRTPLNAIIGYTELLADELTDANHLQDLQRVGDAARSLLGLINGVLDLSKIEAGKEDLEIANVRIDQLLAGPLAMVEPRAAAKGVDLVVMGEFDPAVELNTDSTKLEQVLTNLLTNAVKFTPVGRVSLVVELWRRENLPWLRLSVVDTGIGLTGEELETVFEPFVQVENDLGHHGTGLGLSICRAYVEMLGGQLYAESTKGEGSRFVVELPVATLADVTPIHHWTQTPLPETRAGNEQRVLIIDDDVGFLALMERVLSAPNRHVITTVEPRQALDWARNYRADLIVLDVAMPSISGWSFLVRLRDTASKDSPVLVVSGAGEEEVAHALGAAGFLQKPVANQELANWVDRLLADEHTG